MQRLPRVAGLALGLLIALPAAGAKPPRASACGKAQWGSRWGSKPPACAGSPESSEKWVAYAAPAKAPGSTLFKVWYVQGDKTAAAAAPKVLGLLNNRYQGLVKLYGRQPLSDAGCPCDGGDGRIDVYLMPKETDPLLDGRKTQTIGFPVEQLCAEPAYITLYRVDYLCAPAILEATLAHELTHVFQHSHRFAPPCLWEAAGGRDPLLTWLSESTARWSEWYFFGGNPAGRNFKDDTCVPGTPYAEEYLRDAVRKPLPSAPYAGWMFPLFLSLRYGPQVVPAFWKKLETERDVARAVGAVIAATAGTGKWDASWLDFSAANFNVPPVDDYTRKQIPAQGLRDAVQVDVGGGFNQVPLPSPVVPPLAAHHYEIKVGDGVRLLAFESGLGDSSPPALRVQALPRIAGQPRRAPEDWTRRTVTFCRDRPEENVQDVFLVLSNGDWSRQAPPLGAPAAHWLASDVSCGAWKGHFTYSSDGSGQLGDISSSEHHEVTVDAVFEPIGAGLGEEGLQVSLAGRGTLTYKWSGKATVGGRSVSCGGGATVTFGPGGAELDLRHTRDGRRQYQVAGQTVVTGNVGVGCDGQPVPGGPLTWAWSQGWLPLDSPTAIHAHLEESGDEGRIVRAWDLSPSAAGHP